jgi:hypothetical protein
MAQFDVYRTIDASLVLDLQFDALHFTNTRVVAPLGLKDSYKQPIARANPELDVDGEIYVLLTHTFYPRCQHRNSDRRSATSSTSNMQ